MSHPKRILTVDQGNSCLKLTLFEDSVVKDRLLVPGKSVSSLADALRRFSPDGGIVCSTSDNLEALKTEWRRLTSAPLLAVGRELKMPVDFSAYKSDSLGLDRLALMAGASLLYPGVSVLVIDFGTALTCDLVDKEGKFVGGNISPGLDMRFKALNNFMAALPLVEKREDCPRWGRDTVSAIQAGVRWGIIAEAVEAVSDAAGEQDARLCLLTGGDAPLFYPPVKDIVSNKIGKHIDVALVADLLAFGLLYIYNLNENS